MNHRFYGFILCACLFLLGGCKTKEYTATKFEGEKLVFGTTGGFTGALDAYHLLSNGQLFQQEGRKEVFNALPSLKKKDALAIFKQALDLKLPELKLDQPGNLSKFIEYQAGTTKNKIVWSDESKGVDSSVEQMYTQLMNLIN